MPDDDSPRNTRLYGAIDTVAGMATLAESTGLRVPTESDLVPARLARYEIEDVLGRGGMGEVLSARDAQIGRLVAIKRLRIVDPDPALVARFLREARIQGRLEHPAVVPVHELWHEPGGRPFFVMKQLSGVTLADVLPALADGDAAMMARFPTQRLVRAFADICLALELAHTRGVVHRDLKPANIMLGDFGEVYVLDWGIARVTGADDAERPSFADIDGAADHETSAGAILGTPGYIAPEQIRGERELDGRADVYALGCILFELLALEPLHPRGQAALGTALVGVDARPSLRAPDRAIPPELDAICTRATALDAAQRYPTARALSDAVQRYLDGNRDLALRKQLAAQELAAAQTWLAAGDGEKARREAMRAAARALALDPSEREPADLVGALMLRAPSGAVPEVEHELERMDYAALRSATRFGMIASIAYVLFFAMLYWVGLRDTWYVIAGPALSIVLLVVNLTIGQRDPYLAGHIATIGNAAVFALFAWMVSPVVLGPGPSIILVTLLVSHRRLIRPWLIGPIGVLASAIPWIIQLAQGHLPIATSGGKLVLETAGTSLDPTATFIGLAVYMAALTALATVLAVSKDNEQRDVRRRMQLQSWQLRQLVPRAQGVVSGPWSPASAAIGAS